MDRDTEARVRAIIERAKGSQSALTSQNAISQLADLIAQRCDPEELAHAPSLSDRVGRPHPPMPGYIVAAVMAASRLLTFSNIEEIEATTDPADPSTSDPYKMTFDDGDGWLIGMRGSVVDRTGFVWRSSIGLTLQVNSGDYLITDGERGSFANYDDLFTASQVYFPIRRYFRDTDNLYATFQNYSLTDALTPTLTLWFCRSRDVRAAYQMYKSLRERICD